MAGRKKKYTVDYFPHYINHGKTMLILTTKYGNNGKAFWWTLLEILGKAENHYYDCRSKYNWEYLLSITLLDGISATEILNTLAELEAIDNELWKIKVIWCQKFVNNIQDVYNKRGTDIPEKPIFLLQKLQQSTISVAEMQANDNICNINTQSKVKEIKEKNLLVPFFENTKTNRKKSFCEEDMKLSKLLDSFLTDNNPNKKQTSDTILENWANDVRLMRERDGRTYSEIEKVLRWSQNDPFWREVILSMAKLRNKFDQLFLKTNTKIKRQRDDDRPETY
jgi:hypothetical protein